MVNRILNTFRRGAWYVHEPVESGGESPQAPAQCALSSQLHRVADQQEKLTSSPLEREHRSQALPRRDFREATCSVVFCNAFISPDANSLRSCATYLSSMDFCCSFRALLSAARKRRMASRLSKCGPVGLVGMMPFQKAKVLVLCPESRVQTRLRWQWSRTQLKNPLVSEITELHRKCYQSRPQPLLPGLQTKNTTSIGKHPAVDCSASNEDMERPQTRWPVVKPKQIVPRKIVRVSICQFRGIGQHYHALMQESGKGRSFAGTFNSRMAAETWVMRMARAHFPVRRYRLIHDSREGPWFYRESDAA